MSSEVKLEAVAALDDCDEVREDEIKNEQQLDDPQAQAVSIANLPLELAVEQIKSFSLTSFISK